MYDSEGIIELAEMAHESAMVELEQLGCIEFERGHGPVYGEDNAAAWAMFWECPEYVPFELF